MSRTRKIIALAKASAVGAVLAGLAAAPAAAFYQEDLGAVIPLGENLVGEDCRAVLDRFNDTKYKYNRHRIRCGAWEEQSGTVSSWIDDSGGRSVREWRDRDRYWWRPYIDRFNDCDEDEYRPLAYGITASHLTCTTRDGGFPYMAFVARDNDVIVFADFIPANAEVVERLTAVLTENVAPDASQETDLSGSEMISALRARIEADPGQLFSGGAYARYKTLMDVGLKLDHSRDQQGSADAYREALQLLEELKGVGHPATGAPLAKLANAYRQGGQYEDARAIMDRAEALLRKSANKTALGELLVFRSFMANELGDAAAAVEYAEAGVDIYRDQWDDDSGWVAHGRWALASALQDAGELEDAEDVAEDALRSYYGCCGTVHRWTGRSHALLADIRLEAGDAEDALEDAEAARDIFTRLYGDGLPSVYALIRIMRAETAMKRWEAARQTAFAAHEMMLNAAEEAGYLGNAVNPRAVELGGATLLTLAANAEGETAADLSDALLQIAQLRRQGLSQKVIAQMAARVQADDPALADLSKRYQETIQRRDQVREDLATAAAAEEEERESDRIATLEAELARLNQRRTELAQALQGQYPDYARLVNPRPLKAARVQALLAPGEALVLFVVGRDQTLVAAVTPNGVSAHAASIARRALVEQVTRLRAPLEAGGTEPFDMRAAHALYQQLLAPLAPALAGARHLFIAPDGPLASLPPGLLVTAEPPAERRAYAEAAWLGTEKAISLLPSVEALRTLRERAGVSRAPEPFFGLADPRFGGADDGAALTALAQDCRTRDQAVSPALLNALAPLPETREEIAAIAEALGAGPDAQAAGAAASEAGLRTRDLKRYRGLAFATHGLLPGELRCAGEPGLALTPPPAGSADPATDGLLTASEVFRLDLDADWVLLSACNTGALGARDQMGGESLSSLAGGFFQAGARMVMASHWAVASEPTVTLTTGALTGAVDGVGKAEALRRSQAAMLQAPATAHPAFWAPFTLYGDGAR